MDLRTLRVSALGDPFNQEKWAVGMKNLSLQQNQMTRSCPAFGMGSFLMSLWIFCTPSSWFETLLLFDKLL